MHTLSSECSQNIYKRFPMKNIIISIVEIHLPPWQSNGRKKLQKAAHDFRRRAHDRCLISAKGPYLQIQKETQSRPLDIKEESEFASTWVESLSPIATSTVCVSTLRCKQTFKDLGDVFTLQWMAIKQECTQRASLSSSIYGSWGRHTSKGSCAGRLPLRTCSHKRAENNKHNSLKKRTGWDFKKCWYKNNFIDWMGSLCCEGFWIWTGF